MRWKFVDGAVRRDTDIGARPVTRRPSCPVGLEKAGFLETRVYGRRARPVTSPLPPARRPSAPWGPGGRAAQAPGAPVRRNCYAPAVRMLTGAFSGYNRFARARTPIIGQSTRKHSDCSAQQFTSAVPRRDEAANRGGPLSQSVLSASIGLIESPVS